MCCTYLQLHAPCSQTQLTSAFATSSLERPSCCRRSAAGPGLPGRAKLEFIRGRFVRKPGISRATLLGSESVLLLVPHNARRPMPSQRRRLCRRGWLEANRVVLDVRTGGSKCPRGLQAHHRVRIRAALGLLSRFPAAIWWLTNDDIREASPSPSKCMYLQYSAPYIQYTYMCSVYAPYMGNHTRNYAVFILLRNCPSRCPILLPPQCLVGQSVQYLPSFSPVGAALFSLPSPHSQTSHQFSARFVNQFLSAPFFFFL